MKKFGANRNAEARKETVLQKPLLNFQILISLHNGYWNFALRPVHNTDRKAASTGRCVVG